MLQPNVIHGIGAGVGFTCFAVTQHRIHKPLIQRQLSAIVGNQQHIIHRRVNHSVPDFLCPFRQRRDHFLLLR